MQPAVVYTEHYEPEVANDFRETIRPKHEGEDPAFRPEPYYQVFREKFGFLPNLSIADLLFNMGPEDSLRYGHQLPDLFNRLYQASISFGKISPILPIRNVSASEILPG